MFVPRFTLDTSPNPTANRSTRPTLQVANLVHLLSCCLCTTAFPWYTTNSSCQHLHSHPHAMLARITPLAACRGMAPTTFPARAQGV